MSTSKTSKRTKSTKSVAPKQTTAAKPNGGVGMKVLAAANKGNPPPEN